MTMEVDYIIVGGGLSGLMAARRLYESGASILLAEAKEKLGGRTQTQDFDGSLFELGAQWIGPDQKRINALCQELQVQTFPTFHNGKKILDIHGRIRSYKKSIPSLSPISLLELQRVILKLEGMIRQIDPKTVFLGSQAEKWDRQTVGEWSRKHIYRPKVRTILATAVQIIFGAEPDELSMLHLLAYSSAGGGLMKLCEIV